MKNIKNEISCIIYIKHSDMNISFQIRRLVNERAWEKIIREVTEKLSWDILELIKEDLFFTDGEIRWSIRNSIK